MKIHYIIIGWSFCFGLLSCSRSDAVQTGDFLFQDIDCVLCEGIENVTSGYDGYNFSHVGMVVKEGRKVFVMEAIEDGVVKTPLKKFINRSKDVDGNPKVLQMRLKNG